MRFGISTHLYHHERLSWSHLAAIAAHGFEAVEVFATRTHFDYHDEAAIAELAGWLRDTGLHLTGVHAPITDRLSPAGEWGDVISNASPDAAARTRAVQETQAALKAAEQLGAEVFVVHLGVPTVQGVPNSRTAAFRSAEEICQLAAAGRVKVAFEVIPNELADGPSLANLLERDLDGANAGICLDFGHAFLMGDVPDTIEAVAEHLIATHVHDNRGKKDDHLVPFDGRINWDMALMTMQKVGFDGTYLMEIASTGDPAAVLDGARRARARFEQLLSY